MTVAGFKQLKEKSKIIKRKKKQKTNLWKYVQPSDMEIQTEKPIRNWFRLTLWNCNRAHGLHLHRNCLEIVRLPVI